MEEIGIPVNQDAISSSLFEDIKKDGSKINTLIGVKKFIEGWDTWRVSSMGLLNIGKGQRPQIIQLFGRGVRLKGKDMTLKRSGKEEIKHLETLNIFSIKADYLNKFLEAIRKEEVEFEEIEIPVKLQHKEKWENLQIIWQDKNKKFEKDEKEQSIKAKQIKTNTYKQKIPQDILELLDWEKIYIDICNFKIERSYWNLVFEKNDLKKLLNSNVYEIKVPQDLLAIKSKEDLVKKIEDIALLVLKKYIDTYYRKQAKHFETENISCYPIPKLEQLQLPLFGFEKSKRKPTYKVKIKKDNKKLIQDIQNLENNLNELLKEEDKILPRIYFDKHLYLPILIQSKNIENIKPAGLVKSEKDFILKLKQYLSSNTKKLENYEIYLLRNSPKSGVGFQLEWHGFYPDFIMSVKKQTIR